MIPIYLINENEILQRAEKIGGAALVNWVRIIGLDERADISYALWHGADGSPAYVIAKVGANLTQWSVAHLASLLPSGEYQLDDKYLSKKLSTLQREKLSLGWLLEQYQYSRYKSPHPKGATLKYDDKIAPKIEQMRDAIFLVRNLINTPPNDMGPKELAQAATNVAKANDASVRIVKGEELEKNYPAIYTVGKASERAPRLIDIRWGNPKNPLVVLVGKGVCFDSGGLDIKNSSNMKLMKKDMGGAACALGLAQLIMQRGLAINLRVLIPAVENSISGSAFRTSDVIKMRSKLTVEVGNTDAEGRLILADALSDACDEKPKLIIDMATLTGAARTALGTDIPAIFSNNDIIADELCKISKTENDLLWRLPLHEGYASQLKSEVADCNSTGSSGYGGAIIAALFLQQFVRADIPWIHIDMMAWNLKANAGRPAGGEAMGLRAIYAMLEKNYPKTNEST